MRATTFAAIAALLAAGPVLAEGAPKAAPELQPVIGGMSTRLAGLSSAVRKDKQTLIAELTRVLDKSREDAHRLIDEMVDKGQVGSWLAAMGEKSSSDLAAQLEGKSPEMVKAALHSRLNRKLAKLGAEIAQKIHAEDPARLAASFELAMKDLTREETNFSRAAEVGLKASEDGADAPAAPGDSPSAPAWAYMNPGGVRAYNAYGPYRTAMANRTLAVAQQRAYFQQQLAAAQWHRNIGRFNTYLYGSNAPAYANPRFRGRCVPGAYYYRPDRVERVVRRGLWGAAAVVATPFALVASIF